MAQPKNKKEKIKRLLVATVCAEASEILGFAEMGSATSRECVVLPDEYVFDFLLEDPIHVFLVICHQGFGDGLAPGINVGHLSHGDGCPCRGTALCPGIDWAPGACIYI